MSRFLPGHILAITSLVLLVAGLDSTGWPWWSVPMLAATVALFAYTMVLERRATKRARRH